MEKKYKIYEDGDLHSEFSATEENADKIFGECFANFDASIFCVTDNKDVTDKFRDGLRETEELG